MLEFLSVASPALLSWPSILRICVYLAVLAAGDTDFIYVFLFLRETHLDKNDTISQFAFYFTGLSDQQVLIARFLAQ